MSDFSKDITKGCLIDESANYWDSFMSLLGFGEKFREEQVSLAEIKNRDRVLDVGCGNGSLAILEKKSAGGDGIVIGIDASEKMLEKAKEKASRLKVEIKLLFGYAEKLPFETDYFDVVTSSLMFHHLPVENKVKMLEEVRRVLKPGGKFTLIDVGRPTNKLLDVLAYPAKKLDIFEYSKEGLSGKYPEMLKLAGFKEIKIIKTMKFGLVTFIRAVK